MRAREAASCSRAAALASAWAASSAKSAIRCSVPGGNGRASTFETTTAPHRRPPSVIGAATTLPTPYARITSAAAPDTGE